MTDIEKCILDLVPASTRQSLNQPLIVTIKIALNALEEKEWLSCHKYERTLPYSPIVKRFRVLAEAKI